jgi:hypothetical protein
LILLAFFFPVAVYLLVLGSINRRRNPLLVSGVWDFIGVLGASSGFLLGGPAVLTGLSERWRGFWLSGHSGSESSGEGWLFWLALSVFYFALVVGGSCFLLWIQRHLTAIYNVTPDLLEQALAQVFERLGLSPVRTGSLYVFGVPLGAHGTRTAAREGPQPEGIQAPHLLTAPPEQERELVTARLDAPASDLAAETAVLEVHTSPWLWHATLRWDPVNSNLRREVEAELDRTLADTTVPDHDLGAWFTVIGFGLLALLLLVLFLILLNNLGR